MFQYFSFLSRQNVNLNRFKCFLKVFLFCWSESFPSKCKILSESSFTEVFKKRQKLFVKQEPEQGLPKCGSRRKGTLLKYSQPLL